MSDHGTERVAASTRPKSDDGLAHTTCCRDDDPGHVSLCGLDVTDAPWGDHPDDVECVVCTELAGMAACPVRDYCIGCGASQ